jgi:hypothetical protein
LILINCNTKPVPEKIPLSVNSTLNLLQENPQFVMYLNFKVMRRTEFWKKNVSDSLLNAEKTFGSLLNTFKLATGASISEGLDELYYSNSWIGENAIVLKGIFDRNKLNNFLSNDSLFSITKDAGGTTIYLKNDNGLYFFFKDDFTLCASNYLKQLDIMMAATDTSMTGLLLNQKVYNAISDIVYKENLWMVSTEKIFIRGIFQNFLESTSGTNAEETDTTLLADTLTTPDTSSSDEKVNIENLYKRLNAVSFSAEMGSDLKFLVQCESIDEESAKYLKNILTGVITVSKLTSVGKQKTPPVQILDKLKLDRFDNSIYLELSIDESNLQALRSTNLLNEPEKF